MTELEQNIHQALMEEVNRRLIVESAPRIKKCLDLLTEEQIWTKPNAHSNSIGNLVLHLCGNVRQYILSGIGGIRDDRKRQQEFDEKGPIPKEELYQRLDTLIEEVILVLEAIQPEHLVELRKVQGFDEKVVNILVHVVEHFSYHVGQISYYVKLIKDTDLGYYAGLNLDATS